ncbi:MAG: hypothetical protein ACR2GB_08620 [Nocardioidaceae bacterium]
MGQLIGELSLRGYRWQLSLPATSVVARRRDAMPPAKPTAGTRPVPSLAPGDEVMHDSFDMGSVVTVGGCAERPSLLSTSGLAELLRYSPVEKL